MLYVVLDPALATSYAHGLLVHLWQLMPWWLKVFGVPSGFALRLVYKPIKQCIEEEITAATSTLRDRLKRRQAGFHKPRRK